MKLRDYFHIAVVFVIGLLLAFAIAYVCSETLLGMWASKIQP